MCGRATVAAANSTVGTPRGSVTTIFASLMLSIRCSMVRVFLPYSFTSTKISSLTGNQKSPIFVYSRTKSARVIHKEGFLAGCPAILTIAKAMLSIHILPSKRYLSFRLGSASTTKQWWTPRSSSPSTRNRLVRRGDRAIAMLLSDRSRDSALHQPVQNQVTYYLAHRAARLISDATDLLPPDTRR